MQSKHKFVYIALCFVLLFSSTVLLIALAQAPKKAQIAFSSDRDGNYEIYVMDADGQNQRRLTKNSADDRFPAWSPDSQRIAFTSNRDANWETYVMDADGNNQRNLTNDPWEDNCPDWFDPAFAYAVSPAGKLRRTWGWVKQTSK